MAFPVVRGVTPSHVTANATSITVDLPDGSDVAGRLLIAVVTCDGTTAMTWPASPAWTAITNAAGNDGSGASRTEARYRILDGGEGYPATGATISVSGGNEEWASVAFLVGSHASSTSAPECQAGTGTTGNADPPNLAPSWGAADTLWIVAAGLDASVTVTGWPTDYGGNQHGDNTGGTGGCSHGYATRNLNATSNDPGTFTNGSESWRALTIAVRPGSEGSGYTVTADAGSFSTTGTAATLKHASTVVADAGSYTLGGTAASLERGYVVVAASGSVVWTGTDATLTHEQGGYTLAADPGAVAVSGAAASLERGYVVTAASGSHALSGTAADLRRTAKLVADAGAVAVTGTDASLSRGQRMAADAGGYTLTGTAATFLRGYAVTAASGAITVGGTAAALKAARKLTAASGSHAVTGTAATLTVTAAPAETETRLQDWKRSQQRVW